jgi:hypothetical protein
MRASQKTRRSVRAPGARPKRSSLNGSAPDTSSVALLLVDVINEFAFPEARALLRRALPMRERCSALSSARGVPGCRASTLTTTSAAGGRISTRLSGTLQGATAAAARSCNCSGRKPTTTSCSNPSTPASIESSLGVLLDHLGVTPMAAAAVVGVKPTSGVRRRKHSHETRSDRIGRALAMTMGIEQQPSRCRGFRSQWSCKNDLPCRHAGASFLCSIVQIVCDVACSQHRARNGHHRCSHHPRVVFARAGGVES